MGDVIRPPWIAAQDQRAQVAGQRLTAWERAIDHDERAGDVDVKVGPNSDCFSCDALRASGACARMAPSPMTKRALNVILDCFEYRQASDPHALCQHHEMAIAVELERRCRR